MTGTNATDLSQFFIAGINYRKTDAGTRGSFAVSAEKYISALEQSPSFGIQKFFIVSTCNRTEIYGFAENSSQLISLLCQYTTGSVENFNRFAYIKQGIDAIAHLFHVGAGLDSQILGDYEIVGQIKQATRLAKEHNRIDAFIERLLNNVLQSSKAIKNQTALSGGTVSVSFAAVQYIRENVTNIANKKIVIAGTGKIGRNICKNIIDYLQTNNVTLINRTNEKAATLAAWLNIKAAPFENLQSEIEAADIVLVATNATNALLLPSHFISSTEKLIIDLSIPYNVDPAVGQLPGIQLVDVDQLSKLRDKNLARRQADVPKAKEIITKHLDDFLEWLKQRKHVPLLKAAKSKLQEIHSSDFYLTLPDKCSPDNADEKIQKAINGMATKMKKQNQVGCNYIAAINEFISTQG